jgi:hypothetical protein
VLLLVIVNPETTDTLLKFCVADCCGFPLSVTLTENENVPTAVGVPLIVPLALRLKPVGSAPVVTAHVYGGVPFCAASVNE